MVFTRRTAKTIVEPPPPPPPELSLEQKKVVNSQIQPLSLDERLSILSRPKNVAQPVLKRVPSTSSSSSAASTQPVTRRPSLATMKSAGSFANVQAKTDSGRRTSSIDLQATAAAASSSASSSSIVVGEESALASLTRTDSLHKLISAPPPPPTSTYKYVSSSGYGQAGAPARRTSIIVAAANAKASMSTVKPAPPPSSSKASSSMLNRSSSFSRRASFSTSQLSLSFVAASTRKPSASLSRLNTAPSVDADSNDDDLPSPLRRTLLAVISSSCAEAANLSQRGLFDAARTAYEALLTEVPLARRRADVWVARAALESTAGNTAEGMEMLLKGTEACRAVPTEHAKITSALSVFARSAIAGGPTAAFPIVATVTSSSSSTTGVVPSTTTSSTTTLSMDEEEKDPFLLESLGLASSVPIIPKSDSVKKAEAMIQASNKGSNNESVSAFSLPSPSPKNDFQAMSCIATPPPPTSIYSAEDDGYNSPAHAVSVDTDLGLERATEGEDEEEVRYKDLASPPKAVLKTTSKAARVSDFIKHPSMSALKAPFTPLALSSLSSKTPITTQRTVSRPIGVSSLTSPLPFQPPVAIMATPAVLLSARRVPVSSVPQIAKQFWEIEEEEGMAVNVAEEEDFKNKMEEEVENSIAPILITSGTTPATSGRAQRVFLTTPLQATTLSSSTTTKASSRKKTPRNTPAVESGRRRSARLAGVSAETEDEDDENLDSLNSSLLRLAVSTLGYTHAQ